MTLRGHSPKQSHIELKNLSLMYHCFAGDFLPEARCAVVEKNALLAMTK